MEYTSTSDQKTQQIARELAHKLPSRVFALSGELGSGKTTFVQGFAKGLGIKEKIISPTFVLVRQHKIPKTKKTLYHIDLYRLEDGEQIKALGLKEIWQNPESIVVIEWAEKIKELLPKKAVLIYFEKLDNEKRKIEIKTLS